MASARPSQINIRSDYVRQRTAEIGRTTGMTVTRIIESALEVYVPPLPVGEIVPPGMIRVGRILVATGGLAVTIEDVQASIDDTREGNRD